MAEGLASLGQAVAIITNESIGPAEDGRDEPFRVIAAGAEPTSLRFVLRRRQWVGDTLAAEQPDVVLVGDPAAHRVCALLGSRFRFRCWPIFYGSELLDLERLLLQPPWSVGPLFRRALMRRYLRGSGGRICISRHTAGLLSRVMPGLPADCIVYPMVSDLVLREPAEPHFSRDLRCRVSDGGSSPTILLTVGRISARKNQLGVLKAMAHLHQNSPARFHYVVVGNVDAPSHARYLEQMEAYIRAHGLERAVTFVSNASDREKIAYLDACDVFVMLSRTVGTSVEGFGISVLEASCRGKPVLVSDQGGMRETLLEGETGLSVEPDDLSRVAAALLKLAEDTKLRTAMGNAGREFVRREFTPQASARRLHGVLAGRGITRADR